MGMSERTASLQHSHPTLGAKSIGLFGSAMLLTNNLAGPTISLMPALVQQAGWFAMILEMSVLAALSACCGFMLLAAVRAMPGNEDFALRIEYSDLLEFYLPPFLYVPAMFSYFVYVVLTLMSYIIQTAQVMDYAFLNLFGCVYAVELQPSLGGVCGTRTDSDTPFDSDSIVLSSSFILLAVVCAPLAWLNLDDNITLQIIAIAGLTVLACIWIWFLMSQPDFPNTVPVFTADQGPMFGTLLFNFAFMSALPSWANEKRPEVSVSWAFAISMGYVAVVYCLVGIIGGLAYQPYYQSDENLFSKLNASGSRLGQLTVQVYPILQNFTSIPVFAIFIKYNLIQLDWCENTAATFIAFAVPWLLSVPYYTGSGFEEISSVGGLIFSTVINFIVPFVVFCLSRRSFADSERSTESDRMDGASTSHSDSDFSDLKSTSCETASSMSQTELVQFLTPRGRESAREVMFTRL